MEHEFKVGDWVIYNAGTNSQPTNTRQIKSIERNWLYFYPIKNCVNYNNYQYYRPALPHEIPGNQQEINLQVGDTFRNSVGNLKLITYSDSYWTYIKNLNTNKITYDLKTENVIDYIKSGKYTDYTSVSQQKAMKQWKKEDFYNTKIVVDTPEKNRRFQELMFSLGFVWRTSNSKIPENTNSIYLYMENGGYFMYGNDPKNFINDYKKEIFYNDIFNENNNQLNNNQNGKTENNDLLGENLSGNGSKETATAISFRRTSKIATSSGYTGNKIQGRRVDTKIGRSEINFSAISF